MTDPDETPEVEAFTEFGAPSGPRPDPKQNVEGFSELVSSGTVDPLFGGPVGFGMDYRGPVPTAGTTEWWLPKAKPHGDLIWTSATVPEAVDTVFSFIGESANLPDGLYPPNQATLHVDGHPVITFDLGLRKERSWTNDSWSLDFTPKQVHFPVEGHHRQFGLTGCCGLYRLTAPAAAVRAGHPVEIKVVLEPRRTDAITWFAIRQRPDTLEISPRTNAEQVEQLQRELIHLKRIVGSLARRSYPELLPERLEAQEVVIHTDATKHVHQTDVVLCPNGDLLVCFREGTEHCSNDGKIVTMRSVDDGLTWSDRQIVREQPGTDEREASLARLADGTIMMNAWVNAFYDGDGRYTSVPDPTYRGRPGGIYVGRSSDDGRSWSWPRTPIDPTPYQHIYSSERVVELPSGRLLMATYATKSAGAADKVDIGAAIFCSDDKGKTFNYLSTLADLPGLSVSEPALIRTTAGLLVCILRNDNGPGKPYYQTTSSDSGATWTAPEVTTVPGYYTPACFVEAPDGTLLCIHGSREDPAGIYIVPSEDGGLTWDMARRRVVRDDFPPNLDTGYPSAVVTPDGRIMVTYYFNMFGRYVVGGSLFRWE